MFPRLQGTGYNVTSRYKTAYNCVAYVAGDREHWWEPEARGGWYWPPELPLEDFRVENYIRCFEGLGFRSCQSRELEDGIEKIAVLVHDDGEFSHVALQLIDGWWSSKLGVYEDISHASVEHLFDGRPLKYGENVRYMSRPRVDHGRDKSGLILLGRG